MKIALVKQLDAVIGRIASSLLSVPTQSEPDSAIATILLIRPGGIGDAVLLASAIHSIKKSVPAIHITVLAEQRNAGVFPLIASVDEVLCYDRPLELLKVLQNRYDVVIDTEQWYRLSAVVARLARSPVKIGFGTNGRLRMFTHCIDYDLAAYEPENFASLLKPLRLDDASKAGIAALSVPLHSVSKACKILEPLGSDPFVAISPSASKAEKRWGADRFRRLTETLSAFGVNLVVVGGKEERQQGEIIAGGGLAMNLAGSTSLSETAGVIQKSALLVSGDSGVLHIAAGLGVPTVSLFGPGRVEKWAPRGEHHIAITRGLSCSPCTMFGITPPCPNGFQCMRDISVDEVAGAVKGLLTRTGAMPFR